jgi:hypothetical protein
MPIMLPTQVPVIWHDFALLGMWTCALAGRNAMAVRVLPRAVCFAVAVLPAATFPYLSSLVFFSFKAAKKPREGAKCAVLFMKAKALHHYDHTLPSFFSFFFFSFMFSVRLILPSFLLCTLQPFAFSSWW